MKTKGLTRQELSAFCAGVSVLLGSGSGMEEAVGLYAEDSTGALEAACKAMVPNMSLGFGEAAAQTGLFPNYALAVMQTAEASGRLEEGLGRLAEYYDRAGCPGKEGSQRGHLSGGAAAAAGRCAGGAGFRRHAHVSERIRQCDRRTGRIQLCLCAVGGGPQPGGAVRGHSGKRGPTSACGSPAPGPGKTAAPGLPGSR